MEQGISDGALQTRYVIKHLPEDRDPRYLPPVTPQELDRILRDEVYSSPGGDFIDALADGLHASGQMDWRPQAQRLVLVLGDSPGFSLLKPAPDGGSAIPRALDIDLEALALHGLGVLIGTIYHPVPFRLPYDRDSTEQALLSYARKQYAQLASLPQLATTSSEFDPEAMAEQLLGREAAVGRKGAYGLLV